MEKSRNNDDSAIIRKLCTELGDNANVETLATLTRCIDSVEFLTDGTIEELTLKGWVANDEIKRRDRRLHRTLKNALSQVKVRYPQESRGILSLFNEILKQLEPGE